MPVIIPVGKGKRELAPRITPVELRKILWNKFGRRRVFVRRKQFTNIINVYCPERTLLNDVANICCRYEDLCDHPDATTINLIPAEPPRSDNDTEDGVQ